MHALMYKTRIQGQHGCGGAGGGEGADPCLVLTSDPKPRLRWTAELHQHFLDAVAHLGGPTKATPKAIMRTMNVNGLTLFHLKSHLQKYRLGKLSGRDMGAVPKDDSADLLKCPGDGNSSPNIILSDVNEGYEVKEALRVQMEVQRKLQLQVEAEKRLQIRQGAEQKYFAILERACQMLADQILGGAVIGMDREKGLGSQMLRGPTVDPLGLYSLLTNEVTEVYGPEGVRPYIHHQVTDYSTESCLTSHESPGVLALEGSSSGRKKRMMSLEGRPASLILTEANVGPAEASVTQMNSHSIHEHGVWS